MGCVSSRQDRNSDEEEEYSHRTGNWEPGRENIKLGTLKSDLLEKDINDISQNVTEGKLCLWQ